MYVCMYVCMYVRTYVCMYVCIYVCMYVCLCVCACMHAWMYVCMYVYMYIYMYVCMHMSILYALYAFPMEFFWPVSVGIYCWPKTFLARGVVYPFLALSKLLGILVLKAAASFYLRWKCSFVAHVWVPQTTMLQSSLFGNIRYRHVWMYVCMYIYIYIYISLYLYNCIYIYIY